MTKNKEQLARQRAIGRLRIYAAWRDKKLDTLILYEPEPAKVTADLMLVIPALFEGMEERLGVSL